MLLVDYGVSLWFSVFLFYSIHGVTGGGGGQKLSGCALAAIDVCAGLRTAWLRGGNSLAACVRGHGRKYPLARNMEPAEPRLLSFGLVDLKAIHRVLPFTIRSVFTSDGIF
jgi:hypothetical protein